MDYVLCVPLSLCCVELGRIFVMLPKLLKGTLDVNQLGNLP